MRGVLTVRSTWLRHRWSTADPPAASSTPACSSPRRRPGAGDRAVRPSVRDRGLAAGARRGGVTVAERRGDRVLAGSAVARPPVGVAHPGVGFWLFPPDRLARLAQHRSCAPLAPAATRLNARRRTPRWP
ncbi:hypothetical protein HBB16_18545 [Pseudonocardia sp. MCCB 268]|nr:hypothetical protein [Pseudonocardia cytotoxica]